MPQRWETRHFIFHCDPRDAPCLKEISEPLEKNCRRILKALGVALERMVEVRIYPSLNALHESVLGNAGAPRWLVGIAKAGAIHIVSPLDPGPEHSRENIIQAAVHELVHVLVKNINPAGIPRYLDEGVALYEAGQMDEKGRLMIADIVLNGNVPPLDKIESDFVKRGGYCLSYTIAEYIVHRYGYGRLGSLIRDPTGYERIFGVTRQRFEQEWIRFMEKTVKQEHEIKSEGDDSNAS
jgi:RNA polymerase sigma-70 factor (ECF subfamily)